MSLTKSESSRPARHARRIPSESVFYQRLIPLLLVLLGVAMLGVIGFAVGILLGVIPYR